MRLYNSTYRYEESSCEPPHGFIVFLYKILRKREAHRYYVTYDLLPSIRDGRLLDVGCGDGDLIFICRSKLRECYGVDISPLRIEREQRSTLLKIIWMVSIFMCAM